MNFKLNDTLVVHLLHESHR